MSVATNKKGATCTPSARSRVPTTLLNSKFESIISMIMHFELASCGGVFARLSSRGYTHKLGDLAPCCLYEEYVGIHSSNSSPCMENPKRLMEIANVGTIEYHDSPSTSWQRVPSCSKNSRQDARTLFPECNASNDTITLVFTTLEDAFNQAIFTLPTNLDFFPRSRLVDCLHRLVLPTTCNHIIEKRCSFPSIQISGFGTCNDSGWVSSLTPYLGPSTIRHSTVYCESSPTSPTYRGIE